MELAGFIFEVIKCFGGPTCRYVDHHRKLKENMNDLRRKVEDLNTRKQDLELRKEAEVRSRKVVKKEVEKWFENVQSVNAEMENIEKKFHVVSCFSRARLGKFVHRKIEEVDRIFQQGSFPEGVAVDGPPAVGVTLPLTNLEGEMDVKEQIWEYLMSDDQVGIIGVCGMGGIGKTTIMKHINNQLLRENQFDAVIWVTVSRDFKPDILQGDIASSLDIYLPEYKLAWPALLMEILESQRYVLILDDVWEQISLLDVGIPKPTLENRSKLVITSRSIEVCNSMGCKVFKVQPLSQAASFNLFLHQVGDSVVKHPTIGELANGIVRQCGGLPLAIVTIASSMRGVNDTFEWKNVLYELRERIQSVKGLDTQIFEHLKFSFDRLNDSKIRSCFLYCSLYPEDYHFENEELIEKWIDEELIEELQNRQAMHDRGQAIINKLVNNCLLERIMTDGKEGVKIHDVVRDMAVSISRGGHHFMIKAGMQLEEIPSEHDWKEKLEKISESFFEHLHGLRVLDLSHTGIHDLPNSISDLKNLTALVLRSCVHLRYVPSLAKLTALRKLDLFHTNIKEVPHGIDMLENLTYLNLYTPDLKEIPTGILSRLSNLQYLETWWNIKGEEVAKLRKLEILIGLFAEALDLNKYAQSLFGQGPKKYWLGVGSPENILSDQHPLFHYVEDPKVDNQVCFINCMMRNRGLVPLPQDVKVLTVEHCQYPKSLSNFSLFHDANELRTCSISWCPGIECIVDFSLSSCNSLQNIEVLSLRSLPNLLELVRGVAVESISHTPTPPVIFSSLKKFYLIRCSSIKELFSRQQLQGLQNLEHIEVNHCDKLEKIIAEEEGNHRGRGHKTTFVFPKLKTLHLIMLPELKSICSSGIRIPIESLQYLSIINCSKLRKIPFIINLLETEQPSRLSLKYGYVHPRKWWNLVEFDDPYAKDVLSPIVLDSSLEDAED